VEENMSDYQPETITLRVRKGVQVNVEEVDEVGAEGDERVQADRDALVSLPLDLKVAMQRIPDAPELSGRAVMITMCG
jgi:hypothetical protein